MRCQQFSIEYLCAIVSDAALLKLDWTDVIIYSVKTMFLLEFRCLAHFRHVMQKPLGICNRVPHVLESHGIYERNLKMTVVLESRGIPPIGRGIF